MNYRQWLKCLVLASLAAFSSGVCADITSAMSFSPSSGDVSVTFLADMFGVVDGVLSGTGGQIAGQMFAVFNAAVLALGGIIFMYTLMVATLNSANEGQMLGQKWSSIWIPIRTVFGLGLMLPKASGYCVMQIFTMWVIVQGVGAADSIWHSTLTYLKSGGVIIENPSSTQTASSDETATNTLTGAAMDMLAAQVCMKALEYEYQALRTTEMNKGINGKCHNPETSSPWYDFCQGVPDFVGSVNIASTANLSSSSPSQNMPDFSSDSSSYQNTTWSKLSGVCGVVSWNAFTVSDTDDSNLTTAEKETLTQSRTIAVSQLFDTLETTAAQIFENVPDFTDYDCGSDGDCVINGYAKSALGVPVTSSGGECTVSETNYDASDACVDWKSGYGSSDSSTTVLDGSELNDAVSTYNGIMQQALTYNSVNGSSYTDETDFIESAQQSGWMLAGAYFFKLAILNSYVVDKTGASTQYDDDSTLKISNANQISGGTWDWNAIGKGLYIDSDETTCSFDTDNSNSPYCSLGKTAIDIISTVMNGNDTSSTDLTRQNAQSYASKNSGRPIYSTSETMNANSVYGYLFNANYIVQPDSSSTGGSTTIDWGSIAGDESSLGFKPSLTIDNLDSIHKSGGHWDIPGKVARWFHNEIIKPIWNSVLKWILPAVYALFDVVLTPIFDLSITIFAKAMEVMEVENANPIIALANMGTNYIDGLGDTWIAIVTDTVAAAFFPPVLGLLGCLLPLITTWFGVLGGVGFLCAYYVPFVPMLVFTFASIGWLIGVIEGMVAAPIVALGLTVPEGHDAFGKSDSAVMLILSMFLRPSLMIIGYIFGIILSYVGVWVMNEGFSLTIPVLDYMGSISSDNIVPEKVSSASNGMYGIHLYTSVALFYFNLVIYVSMYTAIVQKAFELIHYVPDKVLRWLSGGIAEQLGEGAARGVGEIKSQAEGSSEAGSGALTSTTDGLASGATDTISAGAEKIAGSMGIGGGKSGAS